MSNWASIASKTKSINKTKKLSVEDNYSRYSTYKQRESQINDKIPRYREQTPDPRDDFVMTNVSSNVNNEKLNYNQYKNDMKNYILFNQKRSKSQAYIICRRFIRDTSASIMHLRKGSMLNIPFDIITMIISFYFIEFKFNTNQVGDNLNFINEANQAIVEKVGYNDYSQSTEWSTCSFGDIITNDICSLFEITYKWLEGFTNIALGFARSLDNIQWNVLERDFDYYAKDTFYVHIQIDHCGYRLGYHDRDLQKWVGLTDDWDFDREISTFTLQYDFVKSVMRIYFNKQELFGTVAVESMNQIIPVILIPYQGIKVEVVDWSLFV